MTPFEALYGNRPTNIINALGLPPNVLSTLKPEEHLRVLAGKNIDTGIDSHKLILS